MSKGFIKLNRCETTEWLLTKHPNAYLLLTLIALRAQRTADHPSGIKVGEALIGDHEAAGLTRRQYRTALDFLIINKYLQKIETCRNRKKSTTETATATTTLGTKVKLLDSRIWDINLGDDDHRNGHRNDHRAATERPPSGHEEEVKKEKNVKNVLKKAKANRSPSHSPSSYEEEERRQIDSLKDFFGKKGILIDTSVALRWIKKFGTECVMLNLAKLVGRIVDAQNGVNKPIGNHESWMEDALKKNYAGEDDLFIKNKSFLESFCQEKVYSGFTIQKTGCYHLYTKESISFKMKEDHFQNAIERLYYKDEMFA